MRTTQAQKDQLIANQTMFKAQYAAIKGTLSPAQQSSIEMAIAQWDTFIAMLIITGP